MAGSKGRLTHMTIEDMVAFIQSLPDSARLDIVQRILWEGWVVSSPDREKAVSHLKMLIDAFEERMQLHSGNPS